MIKVLKHPPSLQMAYSFSNCYTNNVNKFLSGSTARCLVCGEELSFTDEVESIFYTVENLRLICQKKLRDGTRKGCWIDMVCVCDEGNRADQHGQEELQELYKNKTSEPTLLDTTETPFGYTTRTQCVVIETNNGSSTKVRNIATTYIKGTIQELTREDIGKEKSENEQYEQWADRQMTFCLSKPFGHSYEEDCDEEDYEEEYCRALGWTDFS